MIRSLFASAVACSFAPLAAAQVDLTWTEGIVGGYWRQHLEWTAPGGPQLWYFIPSLQSGPTPLALLDPSDPRLLDVGLDLFLTLASSGLVVGGGADIELGLPEIPALVGATLFGQALTLPGPTTTVDAISQPIRMVATPPGATWIAPERVETARRLHTLTELEDGRVAVIGGFQSSGLAAARTEIYDPQVQGFDESVLLLADRGRHTAVQTSGNKVLVFGGVDAAGNPLSSGERVDFSAGTATPIASMGVARVFHATVALDDGRVLVAGGSKAFTAGDPLGFPAALTGNFTDTLELYDPIADTWSTVATLPTPRTAIGATLLPDGRVLLTGGIAQPAGQAAQATAGCFVFDPADNSLAAAPSLPKPLALHGQILAADGSTLLIGGGDFSFGPPTFTGSLSTFRLPNLQTSWDPLPDLKGIVACVDIVCVPRPGDIRFRLTPVGVADVLGELYDWADAGTTYFAGSGIDSIQFEGGASVVTFSSDYQRIFDDYANWDIPAVRLLDRPASRMIATDGGRRILTVGRPSGTAPAVEDTAELLTLP